MFEARLVQRKRKQYYLRLEVFNLLRGMRRNHSETCPIRLQSTDGSQRVLTYDDIVSFMETFKKQEKVNKKLAIAFQKAVLESLQSWYLQWEIDDTSPKFHFSFVN